MRTEEEGICLIAFYCLLVLVLVLFIFFPSCLVVSRMKMREASERGREMPDCLSSLILSLACPFLALVLYFVLSLSCCPCLCPLSSPCLVLVLSLSCPTTRATRPAKRGQNKTGQDNPRNTTQSRTTQDKTKQNQTPDKPREPSTKTRQK